MSRSAHAFKFRPVSMRCRAIKLSNNHVNDNIIIDIFTLESYAFYFFS